MTTPIYHYDRAGQSPAQSAATEKMARQMRVEECRRRLAAIDRQIARDGKRHHGYQHLAGERADAEAALTAAMLRLSEVA